MFPIATIELIAAHRDNLLQEADQHRRSRGIGDHSVRQQRRIPGLRRG